MVSLVEKQLGALAKTGASKTGADTYTGGEVGFATSLLDPSNHQFSPSLSPRRWPTATARRRA